ncbi:MAG: glycerophosphodiester phosphodiesterase [Vicinamibacterales bacterium]
MRPTPPSPPAPGARPGAAALRTTALAGVLVLLAATTVIPQAPARPASATAASPAIIIGHRGASGHRPEHTIASYTLAIEQGADFIEPDLVSTKDGVLVARHENEIGSTTDAAAKFPARRRTAVVDGETITGWFVEDFTLEEVRTLRAKERLASRSHAYDGQFGIPTFEEVVALAQAQAKARGRPIGVYPETKHPSYFAGIGLPLEPKLLAVLDALGWNSSDAPVFIQSFEVDNLRRLHRQTRVRLVQLLNPGGRPADGSARTYAEMTTPAGLKDIATYAAGIGANQRLIVPADRQGRLGTPTSLVGDAHRAGLLVHVWTLRDDPPFLAAGYEGDPLREHRQFLALGVDGVFTDFPDTAMRARIARRQR